MLTTLEAALQYAGRGWRVFPCYPRAKEPITKHGFKDATVAPSQIETWWSQWPDANLAIATGSISGMYVIDLDGKGVTNMIALAHGREKFQPGNAIVRTARGYHLYIRMEPGEKVRCRIGQPHGLDGLDETGIDIRGDGGYVLAPPSIHPSGAVYRWVDPLSCSELSGLFYARS